MSEQSLFPDLNGAIFSPDRVYRYRLWRVWDPSKPRVNFCMLNPSTADEVDDDPTIRRCIGFAKSWGAGSLEITNIFALRSTDPKALYTHPDPKGPDNNWSIIQAAFCARTVILACGEHGKLKNRWRVVLALIRPYKSVHCLAINASGMPKHPLYIKATTVPTVYAQESHFA